MKKQNYEDFRYSYECRGQWYADRVWADLQDRCNDIAVIELGTEMFKYSLDHIPNFPNFPKLTRISLQNAPKIQKLRICNKVNFIRQWDEQAALKIQQILFDNNQPFVLFAADMYPMTLIFKHEYCANVLTYFQGGKIFLNNIKQIQFVNTSPKNFLSFINQLNFQNNVEILFKGQLPSKHQLLQLQRCNFKIYLHKHGSNGVFTKEELKLNQLEEGDSEQETSKFSNINLEEELFQLENDKRNNSLQLSKIKSSMLDVRDFEKRLSD